MDNKTSEIAKLTERISRDPKSKLFVPLAEEYKKAGDINMAIHVLNEGLKNNPGYVTARSFLGKLLAEKGDLPAAQKEFEEVVRAIPDNLMAQRKLADLYALQDRPTDAAAHYKIALTLNPKDAETAELLAEVEAGREIKSRLRGTKQVETPEQKPQAPAKPAAPSAPAAPQSVPAAKPAVEQQKPIETTAAPAIEEEVAEEVLVVEPLEPTEPPTPPVSSEQSSPEAAPSEIEIPDFLSESEAEQEPLVQGEEAANEDVFSLNEPVAGSSENEEEPAPQAEALPDIFAEEQVSIESAEAPVPSGVFEEEQQVEPTEGTGKAADDFTTDTLAELYISQGFFEKAVDIYERMLIDNPNSQGLKDKLADVRAMAAVSTARGAVTEAVESEIIEAEIVEDQPIGGPEPAQTERPPQQAEPLTSQAPEQVHPRLDDWEVSATKTVPPEASEGQPVKPPIPPKPFDVGFEPREYIPPDAVPVAHQASDKSEGSSGEKSVEHTIKPPIPSRKLTPASKKETVERLEKWLKNIRKEN